MVCSKCIFSILIVFGVSLAAGQSVTPGIKIVRRVYDHCEQSDNLFQCLKLQALKFVDRAIKIDSIHLIDGVSLVRDDEGRSFSNDYSPNYNHLERFNTDAEINGALFDRVMQFLSSRKVEVVNTDEGRKDKGSKGGGGIMLAAMMMKGGLFAFGMKALALLVGKALLVSKMALLLASIVGLKKLFSHEKDGKSF